VVHVFLTGRTHFDSAVQDDDDELLGVRRGLNARSHIAVPLEVGEVRQGVLSVQSTQPDFFSERDLLFMWAVSRWAAGVVERAQLAEHNGGGLDVTSSVGKGAQFRLYLPAD
jgi:GAF domain-containing protein